MSIQDAIDRICALEKEAVPALTVYPYFLVQSTDYPYTTHRLGPSSFATAGEDIGIQNRSIIIRLVIGHITEGGFNGQPEATLNEYIPLMEAKFPIGMMLTGTDSYTTAPDYLYPTGVERQANNGLGAFASPVGGNEVGTEFTLLVPFYTEETVSWH